MELTKIEQRYSDFEGIAWLKKQYPQMKIRYPRGARTYMVFVNVPKDQPVHGFHFMPADYRPSRGDSWKRLPITEGETLTVKGAIYTCSNGLHGSPSLRVAIRSWDYGPIASACLFWGDGEIDICRSRVYHPFGRYVTKWAFRYRKHVAMIDKNPIKRKLILEIGLENTKDKVTRAKIEKYLNDPKLPNFEQVFYGLGPKWREAPWKLVAKRLRDQLRRRERKLTTNKAGTNKEST